MSKLPIDLSPDRAFSKIDRTNYSRMMWKAAYRQSRSMIRDRGTTTAASAYVWALDHLRRRFGASGWPVAQAAASLVFARRIVSGAAVGSVADLERQGLIGATAKPRRGNLVGMVAYRCVTLERTRGLSFAWGGDELACVNRRAALRKGRARALRALRAEDAARRRQIAAAMAQDRRDLETGRFYAITPAGVAALRAAEAACVHA
jgi:hypothetical protein